MPRLEHRRGSGDDGIFDGNGSHPCASDLPVFEVPSSASLGFRTRVIQGPQFGQATSQSNFPAPFGGATGGRTLRLAIGVRF